MLRNLLTRWSRDCRGNIAIMFALASPVLILGVGISIDYGMAARAKARLNMFDDEAALAAVSSSAMAGTAAQAQTTAQDIFTAQASRLPQVTLASGQPSVTITTEASNLIRTATVTYTATYNTIFSRIIGASTVTLNGTSVAQSSSAKAPNTNFYILADNQGSMALPDTQAGINLMMSLTPRQTPNGCAFACHEANPNSTVGGASDTTGNPCQPGTSGLNCPVIDNFQLAANNNITLRFSDVATAINTLISTASTVQGEMNPAPTYNFAVYSVDAPYTQGLYNVMPLTSNYVSTWSTDSANLQLYTVYSYAAACATSGTNPCGRYETNVLTQNTGYFSSPMGTEMQTLASTIPAAGTGASGAAPQEVLLIVTDGVEDRVVSGALSITPWDSDALAACTSLKNNGVRIAILYTTYYYSTLESGFILSPYVERIIDNLGPTLQSCASPGLFMTAGLAGNLSTDLLALFQQAIQSPRLTQ